MKYRKFLLSSLFSFLIFVGVSNLMNAASSTEISKEFGELTQEKLAKILDGYKASFVLYDGQTKHFFRYDPELCKERMSPCSTFKIFNSLVGLDTGVIRDENYSMKWDGTKYPIDNWNRDQTLQSAVTNSTVWYFQRLASAVGNDRMQQYIHEVHYGNEDISGGITQFWLANSLKISADEQVDFLKRLLNDDLPFSKRSMAIVRGLIRLDQNSKGALYGKTGSDIKDGKKVLGWFVGYLVQPERIYVFATNIQAAEGAWGIEARELTERILSEAGLL